MNEDFKKKYHAEIDENIRKYGFHMTFVFSNEENNTPSFCYSTGIYYSFQIPEIFISSLPKNLSFQLISNYVELYKIRKLIPIGLKINELIERFPVYLIEVANENLTNYVLSSERFYKKSKYQYLQIVYPDTNGYFPNEIGYRYDQEIMGNFNPKS